jgi:2-polyprenyl-3-methyl-5-hydroxy-6-metoxy-1,4-benzoquinol methylase
MSLLTSALRTVFEVASGKRGPEAPATLATVEGAAERTEAPPTDIPAWKLLAGEIGVQDLSYGDIARPGVQRLFGHVPRRLLDIGCATGAVSAGLKQAIPGLWAWGCELSEAAAQVAATRLDHVTAAPRERWSEADRALVRSLDTVLLLDVLEHMYNPWAELEFLARELPRDAQVVVSLPNIGHHSVLQELAEGQFPYAALGILDVTHVRFFTLAGMSEMFDQTGWQVEETWILSRSENAPIESFPAQVGLGRLTMTVETAEEWDRLNTVQFGFRLRHKTSLA